MRIVAVADTHTFQDDLGEIPAGDVFVHAGDLLRRGSLDELGPVAEWIRSLPHRYKVVVAGNHDWCFARSGEREVALEMLGDGVIYLQDSSTVIEGAVVYGAPWQPEFGDWAFNLPRGRPLRDKWDRIPDATDVLITHAPPLGFGDESSVAGRQGCAELLAAVRRARPLLHVFGHIHEDGGAWRDAGALISNVTTWECERAPSVLDLDVATRRVTEVSIPPARKG